jgi:hypothetical protein
MAKRPPGRPKALNPKDIKVTVRLSEHEADVLQRVARDGSLSQAIRRCIDSYVGMLGGERVFPDTPRARIRRAVRQARKPESPEAAALLQAFSLEELAAPEAREREPVPGGGNGDVPDTEAPAQARAASEEAASPRPAPRGKREPELSEDLVKIVEARRQYPDISERAFTQLLFDRGMYRHRAKDGSEGPLPHSTLREWWKKAREAGLL